jgi:CHAT domain-containing protein/tetratricopeptide (TPR) repeat protein
MSLEILADLHEKMGSYTEAKSAYHEALDIRFQTLGDNNADVARIYNRLGRLYIEFGDYIQAEKFLLKANDIQRNISGERNHDFASYLFHFGLLYFEINDHKKAESIFHHVLELCEALDEKRLNAETLHLLGQIYHTNGQYQSAERFYLHALKIYRRLEGEESSETGKCLNSLGALYMMKGKYSESRSYLSQALRINSKIYGENHPEYALNLNGMAVLEHALGNYADAEHLFLQSIDIWTLKVGLNNNTSVIVLYNIAELYLSMDRPSEAFNYMKQAEDIEDYLVEQIFLIGSERQRMLYLKNLILRMNRLLALIVRYFPTSSDKIQIAMDLVLRRKFIVADAFIAQREVILGDKYPHLRPNLQELANVRSQISLTALAGPVTTDLKSYQNRLAENITRKEQIEADLAKEIPSINLGKKMRSANHDIVAKGIPAGAVLVEFIQTRLFDFDAIRGNRQFSSKSTHYLAFILTASNPNNTQMIDLGKSDYIDHLIADFRKSIINNSNDRHLYPITDNSFDKTSTDDIGLKLFAAIFNPLLSVCTNCKRIFLCPDGDLTLLPFETLPTIEGNRVIDTYEISYLSVGRDILRFGIKPDSNQNPPLVIADPDYDLTDDDAVNTPLNNRDKEIEKRALIKSDNILHFNSLPGTRLEGEKISQILGVKLLSGKTALEYYLKVCHSPSILHLATHGFFLKNRKIPTLGIKDFYVGMTVRAADVQRYLISLDGVLATPTEFVDTNQDNEFSRLSGHLLDNPFLRSGLALGGANTWLQNGILPKEAEDGILTAEDVSTMDLSNTELTVLSACETGLGEVSVGEGVFGLRRAFLLAGAQTLVMSLWKVPDNQTKELMIDFYEHLLSGKGRAEALREAQLAMKEKYPDPYYWGAFICQGNPGHLSNLNLTSNS